MGFKTFSCANFNPSAPVPCKYTVTGEEDWTIEQADDHVIKEHGYTDTPILRQEIKDSLRDATPVDPTEGAETSPAGTTSGL